MSTKQTEALKLARKALEPFDRWKETVDALAAIDEALAQPEQEPVAWMHPDGRVWTFGRGFDKLTFTIPLYTTPPQRKPLTDEEIETIWQNTSPYYDHQDFARDIEAAHGIKE